MIFAISVSVFLWKFWHHKDMHLHISTCIYSLCLASEIHSNERRMSYEMRGGIRNKMVPFHHHPQRILQTATCDESPSTSCISQGIIPLSI